MSATQHQGVGIIGGGLVGCLAALAFAAKGYSVTIFELRPDPSSIPSTQRNLRSINLAVSDRGIRALRYVDEEMALRVLENVIPMHGRMIHDAEGKQELQLYGLFGESINSIDRSFLNDSMLDEIKRHEGIKILFDHKLIGVSGMDGTPKITLEDNVTKSLKEYEFDYVIGADGAHSQFRYQLQKSMRMNFTQRYIDMQYIELSIPPKNEAINGEPEFYFLPNHLHIWPRTDFMLIALANKDGSFTCTFFSKWSLMEEIESAEEFLGFFQQQFPDAVSLIGEENLKSAYTSNPRGSLMQVEVYPYHHPSGRALLLGDAAHLMVPFYGQGMNCGFEDVRVLMELIDKHTVANTTNAFKEYSVVRQKDLQTICKLALDNYYEMSHKVTDRWYLLRKNIDYALGKLSAGGHGWFKWIPMYTMISFRGDIPYSKAVEIEQRQARILRNIELGTIGVVVIAAAARLWHQLKR